MPFTRGLGRNQNKLHGFSFPFDQDAGTEVGRWGARSSLFPSLCSRLQALSCGPRELGTSPIAAGERAGPPYRVSYTTEGIVPLP